MASVVVSGLGLLLGVVLWRRATETGTWANSRAEASQGAVVPMRKAGRGGMGLRVLKSSNTLLQNGLVAIGLGGPAALLFGHLVNYGHPIMEQCRETGNEGCGADGNTNSRRHTLALDLDETLVHCFESEPHWALQALGVSVLSKALLIDKRFVTVKVGLRPHLFTFLEEARRDFHVVIYTASEKRYADALLEVIEKHCQQATISTRKKDMPSITLRQRLYRNSCRQVNGTTLKDIRLLSNDLAQVAIVDNCSTGYVLTPENGIPIRSWRGNPFDRALLDLLPLLRELSFADDVRNVLTARFDTEQKLLN